MSILGMELQLTGRVWCLSCIFTTEEEKSEVQRSTLGWNIILLGLKASPAQICRLCNHLLRKKAILPCMDPRLFRLD